MCAVRSGVLCYVLALCYVSLCCRLGQQHISNWKSDFVVVVG